MKEITYPVTGTDFYPTLLDLANIPLKPLQHVDGVSLKPLLEGKDIKDRSLFWHYPHYGNQGGEPASMIREGDWKLIHYWEDGNNELYNLVNDPGEQSNVLQQQKKVATRLENKLHTFLTDVNANRPEIDTTYNSTLAIEMYRQKTEVLMPRLEAQRLNFLSSDFQPNKDWWNSKITKD